VSRCRIDVPAARRALLAGETLRGYAERAGCSVSGLRAALRRDGFRMPRKRSSRIMRLYDFWRSVRSRCENSGDRCYPRYGAQGVRVCKAWQAYDTFQVWALATGWMPGASLVMRNPRRGYRPSNCSWGTREDATQAGLTAFGETKSISAWGRDSRAVVSAQTIRYRIHDGIDPESAIASKTVVRTKRGKAHPYRRIDWKRVYRLRHHPPVEIARRLGNAYTAILRGMAERGWLPERRPKIRELEYGHPLHAVWKVTLPRQGKRGWPDFASFYAWALRSGYKPGLRLARPDRTKPASPRNALWLSERESWEYRRPLKVTRTPQRLLRAFGETKGVTEWARDPRCVVTVGGLLARLDRGVPPAKAITGRKRREAEYSSSKELTAWGVAKPLAAWARDRRARVGAGMIRDRIQKGWSAEEAIGTRPFGRPQ
jgi:hypothetical protein